MVERGVFRFASYSLWAKSCVGGRMKTKTYIVTVTILRDVTYKRVTAKNAKEAREETRKQFMNDVGQYIHIDRIKVRAVADWVKKEE